EIAKDRELNRARLDKELMLESSKFENSVKLSQKRIEDIRSQIEVRQAEANEVLAAEEVSTKRDKEVAQREKDIALIRAAEQAEVDTVRVASEVETVLSMAKAKADATRLKSEAEKDDMLAKATGTSAMIAAENSQSKAVIEMKLASQKLSVLPEVVEKMMKPAEKIEGIRINNISGFGKSSGGEAAGASDGSSVNKVIDGVLDLALQLPAVKKIGEEVGLNVSEGLKGISDSLESGVSPKNDQEKDNNT
ncbi:MAG: flotillin domain-containing protein, partial [Paracoccaceae bacterium]